jgi:hypothetical protein
VTIDAQTWVVTGDPAASDDGGDDDTDGDSKATPAQAASNTKAGNARRPAAAKPPLSDAEFKAKEKSCAMRSPPARRSTTWSPRWRRATP